MSTAGAIHLARSSNWLASRRDNGESLPAALPVSRPGTLFETAISHMDQCRLLSFLRWIEDALEGNDIERKSKGANA